MAGLHVPVVVTRTDPDSHCASAALDGVVVVRNDHGQEIGAHLVSVVAVSPR